LLTVVFHHFVAWEETALIENINYILADSCFDVVRIPVMEFKRRIFAVLLLVNHVLAMDQASI